MKSQVSDLTSFTAAPDLLTGSSAGDACNQRNRPRETAPPAGAEMAWRDVLGLWLSWNEVSEQVGARMFKAGENLHELEALLDRADQMRFEAIRRSKALLGCGLRQAG